LKVRQRNNIRWSKRNQYKQGERKVGRDFSFGKLSVHLFALPHGICRGLALPTPLVLGGEICNERHVLKHLQIHRTGMEGALQNQGT